VANYFGFNFQGINR